MDEYKSLIKNTYYNNLDASNKENRGGFDYIPHMLKSHSVATFKDNKFQNKTN